jgi:pimeloyl-ACP methyl ester carboxylesterase
MIRFHRMVLPVAVLMASCTVDIPQEARPRAVRALWDPSTSTLPTPTDLVRDEVLGQLALPIDTDMSPAEREFRHYLNLLDGYPLPSTMTIPLSGPINPYSIPGALVMVEVGDIGGVELVAEYDPQTVSIKAYAKEGLEPGRSYIFGLWGYDGGVRGANGEPVVADAAFYMVRQPYPMTAHVTAMPGASRAEREAAAERLEEVQQDYEVLFRVMQQRGIPREHVASASSFTTTSRPAIWFDATGGKIPMPNNLLLDPVTGLVDLPIADDADEERREILEGLSTYDGFSMSGAITARSTHRLGDHTHLDRSAFRLFERRDDGAWSEVDDVVKGRLDDDKTLWLRPTLTLEPETDYAYVLTRDLVDGRGQGHESQPLGAMLKFRSPLLEEGRSTLGILDDAQAARLEPVRAELEGLLDGLSAQGVSRSQIAAAVPFRTASAASRMLELRSELYTRSVPTTVVNVEQTEPTGGLRTILANVSVILRGEITILDHLDPRTRAKGADYAPVERRIKFSMTLPRRVEEGKRVPMVLFGHGLMTSRELLYLIGDELAVAGYGALAIDLPYHGARSVCRGDEDCGGGSSCDAYGQCVYSDGRPGELVRFEIPYLLPFLMGTAYDDLLSYPASSGHVFVDVEDLFATRDHVEQAVLDLMQAVRVIRGPHLRDYVYDQLGVRIDGEDLVYLGMSLGGVLGAHMAALEPHIETFVLNVPGADLFRLIESSDIFATLFEHGLHSRGIDKGTDEYFLFGNLVRWILDPVDPLNTVQHALHQPLRYVDPSDGVLKTAPVKRVMIQMAEGDLVVPNVATEALSARMGVPIRTYRPTITNHGFLFDPNPFATSSRTARQDMVEFFNGR